MLIDSNYCEDTLFSIELELVKHTNKVLLFRRVEIHLDFERLVIIKIILYCLQLMKINETRSLRKASMLFETKFLFSAVKTKIKHSRALNYKKPSSYINLAFCLGVLTTIYG